VDILPSGELKIGPPLSKPGDFVDLRAEMDLAVGITACSAEKSNNHSFKPIDLEVHEREGRLAPRSSSSHGPQDHDDGRASGDLE
jgi:uncharacterized protein YcgI (DUF1989 family)